MNLLRNGLLMRKTGDRRRTDMTEICAFLRGFSVEFITLSKGGLLRDTTLLPARPRFEPFRSAPALLYMP
jgi:hypothetical protein